MRTKTSTWYETKVRYQKTTEEGVEKKVTEKYVVDALSVTEAESKIMDEMAAYNSVDLFVLGVVEASYKEIFFTDNSEDDRWFKAKVCFITIDEKSMKEKRTNVNYLIQAKSLESALKNVKEMMHGTMTDYDVVGLNETKILDVFEHELKEEA